MSETYQKSSQIFQDNLKWLLNSEIRIKSGKDKGALFGWKNLNPVSFPFIYSEIRGYSITCFSWIYSQLSNTNALQAAKGASEWIIKNLGTYMLVARASGADKSDQISNYYYAFDNGMIMIGLLNLYKITRDPNLLELSANMGKALIERFFDGSKLTARLDELYSPIIENKNGGIVKWSTISGSYHSKLSIGLLELSRLTRNVKFKQISDSICDYAIALQKSNGRFVTNGESNITYLHPHLYSCEGLIYSGQDQLNANHYSAGLKGIRWALDQTDRSTTGGLLSHTGTDAVEQSDCTAQLLRLLILCRNQLKKFLDSSKLDDIINRLHSRLLDFYIPYGKDQGGMRYQLSLNSACSWCTMFSMQALHLCKIRDSEKPRWIEYFI